MPIGRYRITNPIVALFHEGGRHIAHTIPTGAFITVDSAAFEGNKLVDVTWDNKKVMMFTDDLRSRLKLSLEGSK
ncbi:MAG: hypothetical protein WAM39_31565 [Bryobacteraceae bacterium]